MKKQILFALLATAMLWGCGKYDDSSVKSDISNLQGRVATLEGTVKLLDDQIRAGALVQSVTPLADNKGWRITFTGGSPSSIDLLHGAKGDQGDPGEDGIQGPAGDDGVTPMLEVRYNAGTGKTTLWVNYGSGWTDTGVDLTGPQGDPGTPGTPGAPGASGISPKIEVRTVDGVTSVWYNVTRDYPESGWTDTGVDLSAIGPVLAIADNRDGTVTFTMNDGKDPHDTYTFEKASTAVRFEIMTTAKVTIAQGGTGTIVLRVNPSNGWIPTTGDGDMSKWAFDQVGTRASYVNPSPNFSIAGIAQDGERQGQYIATIRCTSADAAVTDYVAALVLNTASEAKPALVSSPPFVLGAEPPVIPVIETVLVEPPAAWIVLGGDSSTEPGNEATIKPHYTGFTYKYRIAKYEVTNGEFAAFLNANGVGADGKWADGSYPDKVLVTATPSNKDWGLHFENNKWAVSQAGGTDYSDYPVVCVSWFGAAEFAAWVGGRLPTGAEWEYACRAGKCTSLAALTPFGVGTGRKLTGDMANFYGEMPYDLDRTPPGGYYLAGGPNLGKTASVGSYAPNDWGLYDMHGNVSEWCNDWYGYGYHPNNVANPQGPTSGTRRLVRGGGIGASADGCRSAVITSQLPDYALDYGMGFRIAKNM